MAATGLGARASVTADKVEVGPGSEQSLPCRFEAARAWASARLRAFTESQQNQRLPRLLKLSEADASMLNAMLFGDRAGLSHSLRLGFERTGSFHLFVVSGMHLALLAGGVYWLLRRVRAAGVACDRGHARPPQRGIRGASPDSASRRSARWA